MTNRTPTSAPTAPTPAPEHAGESADWRARLRGSRFGSAIVLAVTTALVLVGAWFVNEAKGGDVSEVSTTAQATGPAPKVGAPAQDFTARTVDGRTVKLSDYRGRPVWVLFGASWCTSCRTEVADVEALYRQAKKSGVEVLAVYLGEDAMTVRDYSGSTGLTYPQIPDPDTQVSSAYRVMGIPAHFFVDRNGTISSIQVGALDKGQMEKSLRELG